jgi:hypothetical protein
MFSTTARSPGRSTSRSASGCCRWTRNGNKGLANQVPWPTEALARSHGGGIATLRALIREYLFISLFRACAESLASENASRLAAMERADKNIEELLESLTSTFHRLRQSGIDEELFDVISGFEAQGALERDENVLAQAQMDLERYRAAWARNGIAKQILDDQEKLVLQDQGTVKNDQGTVQYDQVQVDFCSITAPIAGRVGLRLVDPGNVVQSAGTVTLAVITQLEPITVIFTIPEDSLGQVEARLRKGAKLPVDAFDRTAQKKIASGTLLTIDNQIDTTTGTVKGRRCFDMSPSRPFILRPVATALLMAAIFLVGNSSATRSCRSRRCRRSIIRPSRCSRSIRAPARRDGDDGDRAAGAAVRRDAGPEPDDLDQFRRHLGHRAAVQPQPEHRCRRRGGAVRAINAAQSLLPSILPAPPSTARPIRPMRRC